MVLSIRDLSVSNIVKNVSLDVQGNVVLLGHNGAGKSTLAKAIMGFVDYKGEVLLEGKSLNGLKPHERVKQGIAYVMQNLPDIEHISVKRLFYICNTNDDLIDSYLEKFHLPFSIKEKKLTSKELSGGERKKVELICAFLSNPKVLILDEVDAGLDAGSKKILLEEIKDKNVLIITHDVSFAEKVEGKIILMENGKLVQEGGKEVIDAYERA